jgi:hypothetical protein
MVMAIFNPQEIPMPNPVDPSQTFTGQLQEHSLPELLQTLQAQRAVGILTLHHGREIKSVYLKEGEIVFATSNQESDRLGDILLRIGRISRQEYDCAVKMIQTTGKRQGAILVELGFLNPSELFEGLKVQIKEILFSLFLWDEGEFEFRPGGLPRQTILLRLDPLQLIPEIIDRLKNSPVN